jgi:transposase-like protein
MIDGLDVAGQCVVVALVITADGTKVPVGLWLGDTENKTVVTALLADLVARDLDTSSGVLCVIDGAKALAAGVKKVFGDAAQVQRCTLHKRRNLDGHLRKELAGVVDRRLGIIFAQPDADKGLAAAQRLAKELEADHPDAAASLREGLEDMFTVARLGISGPLAKTLTNTNCIESMISITRRTTGRVTKWKDGAMKKRWIAAGMLEAERSFRRVRGYKDMAKLVEALRRQVTPAVDIPEEYVQAAA